MSKLPRRVFLRAAGVAVALPWMASLQGRRAQAASDMGPLRLVCINTPLGLHPANFFPQESGTNFTASPYLEPLSDLRSDWTVISGLSHPDVGPSHDSNQSLLTAAPHPEHRAGFRNSISLDQFAAESLMGQTRFSTLTLSCEGAGLSWTKSGAPVPTEVWPSSLFAKLFLEGRPEDIMAQRRRMSDGRSALDTLREQARRLQANLGAEDREKLDEYLTSIRELEFRLAQAELWSQRPKPQVNRATPANITNSADLIGKTRLWFELIHLALQTDSSRLITLQLLGTSSVPPTPGVNQGHHDLSHHGQDPGKIAQLKILELAKMQALADFLKTLKLSREGSSTLLDRTSVLFTSNLGDASKHSVDNLPVLLAGGRFRHGQHLVSGKKSQTPLCNLFVSLLQGLGLEVEQFASSTGSLRGLEVLAH